MNEQATVAKFKEIAGNYKILHIATHGIVDNQNPVHSRLLFSPVTMQTDGADLQYNDLFNLQLNADLAVLSACNTGYGRNSEGEGIIALSRGFLYSGVPSLVISLWKVEDESTAAIMKSFYKYLKDGFSKDESLRKAKLDYLKKSDKLSASPYYWSGFVNIGNKDPLHLSNPSLNYLWLLLILIPVPGYLIHRRKRRTRKITD
jgi:CHAT domain-containing protein